MANPFEEDEDELVKEGLLCPVCLKDFRTVKQLQEHYLNIHGNDFEAGYSLSSSSNEPRKQLGGFQLKSLFGKKGKKFLKNDSELSCDDGDFPIDYKPIGPSFVSVWRQQMVIGQTKSHFDYFKKIRDPRIERYVIETNKLLIRLDKLITDAPTDPEKRKIHEQNVVQWVNDPDVKLCPSCAKSFNLSRRRHHCRLCGGIMCHGCSQFLEFSVARKLISPTNLESSELVQAPKPTLTRRGSSGSLISMVSASGDPHIRVCKDCKVLLDKREKQIEEKYDKPIVYQLYTRIRSDIEETEKLVPIYIKMYNSLSSGEIYYNLKDGEDLRLKLMKLAESIDVFSKKIAALNNEATQVSSKQIQLQNSIRMGATHFLKETMLGLPSLPNQEELKNLQEQRRVEIQRKIEQEKQLAYEQIIKPSKSHSSSISSDFHDNSPVISPDNGWGPEFTTGSGISEKCDPMLQQIKIIKNYIKQARDAHKYDEVHMLEENLKELEIEYFTQNHTHVDD